MERIRLEIQKCLSAVLSKRPGWAVLVWGELGVGKSHLIQTLLKETPCRSFCLKASAGALALTRVLQQTDLPVDMAKVWEQMNQGQFVEPAKQAKVVAAVLSELAPVVLHLENLHDAGEQLEWIQMLTPLLSKQRGVGLLLTGRVAMTGLINLELPRLDRAASDELLHAQHQLPTEGLEWVYRRALGNPLFSLEYLTYLTRQGYFWSDGTRWHWRIPPADFVPPTLEALLVDWVNKLSIDLPTRQVIETRAILPKEASEAVWAAVAGLEAGQLAGRQIPLYQAGFLRDGQFTHPLVGQIIRAEISAVRRREYAERALAVLGQEGLEPSADLIAAANLGHSKTLQIYQRLAEEAKTKGDLARAGYWLALASEGSAGVEQTRLALEAAQLLRHSDLAQATQLAQTAAYAPPHDPQAVYLSAELWVQQGDTEQAETLLGLLSQQERSSQRWWETLIRLHYTSQANHDEVLRVWQLQPKFQSVASPETLLCMGGVLGQKGRFAEAFGLLGPLLQTELEPYLRCRIHEMRGMLHYLQGNSAEAAAENGRAVELARGLGRPTYLAKLLRKEGLFSINLNKFSYAVDCYRQTIDLQAQHGSALDHAHAQATLAPLLVDYGRYEEAEGLFLQSLSRANGAENRLLRCDCRIGLALLYLDWQPPYGAAMALRHAAVAVEEALAVSNQQMLHAALSTQAMSEAVYGDAEKALALAQQSARAEITGDSPVRVARTQYALGLAQAALGETAQAIQTLRASEQAHHDLGFGLTAQRFGLEADRLENNTNIAAERLRWFRAQELLGGATIALRYFPQLQPEVSEQPSQVWTRLNLLGSPSLTIADETTPYRGRKRLELLAYLLEARIAGKSEVGFLELVDALYPDSDEAGAKAILKQLVYLLRNQLGPAIIVSTATGYALGALDSDVETFLKTRDPALWRGAYLEGIGEGWETEVRERLLEGLQSCCSEVLPHNPREALRLGEIALALEPYDTALLRQTVQAAQAAGEMRRAEKIYQLGVGRLKEVGEILPDSSSQFLTKV